VKEMQLRGLYPATVTPFDEDFGVDNIALDAHLTETLAAEGVQGIVVNGHIGEVLALTSDEREAIVRRAVALRPEGKLVFAGVEARTAAELVREGNRAKEAGADGLLVLPPVDVRPYRRLSKHVPSVLHFFKALNDKVGLPMIVHQYPDFTGCSYSIEVLLELAKLEHVVAIKSASFTVTRHAALWDALHDKVSVLAATDAAALLGMLLHGAHGALIGVGVIAPSVWAEVVEAATGGDAERARQLFTRTCMPILDTVFEHQEPSGPTAEAASTKEALVNLGQLTSSRPRPPAVGVSEHGKQEIAECLAKIGLIPAKV
jgi:4-hydroxy-tetrahydrodipicolinate synthase